MPRPKTQKKPKYEPVLQLPPLSHEEFTALRDNIAVNGVLIPILIDSDGPIRKIIDGNYRKRIADQLGYDCPEIVQAGLDEEEKRTLARALNIARRQLNTEQKRALIADQLRETPNWSLRRLGKMLGVDGKTVASVRAEMASTAELPQFDRTVGEDGKYRPANKPLKAVARSPVERNARIGAVTLIEGDCRTELKKIASHSVDAIITDPIYPEVNRQYGRITEEDWHDLMRAVVGESRRILKPKGSTVFILQPNFEKIGKMRLWIYDFVAWAGRELGLVQDCYWWAINCLPTRATQRNVGLMRQSIKWCVWLGPPDCYRNQDAVLWEASEAMAAMNWSDRCLRNFPSGHTVRPGRVATAAIERGGVTPFNVLPLASTNPGDYCGHPASTPCELAAWWCRYILPAGGVLLDPFVGSGTILAAGLDHGASKVIGIDKEIKYIQIASRRIAEG
jgi:DNA modification methylase